MRERLNVRPAVAVLVAVVLAVGGVALLHSWQVRRHAAGLVELAEAAEARGKLDRAASLLAAYLQLAPHDTAVRARYGMTTEKLARDAKSRAAVAAVYEQVLVEAPDRADVRLRLVRLYAGDERYPEAVPHLTVLGGAEAADPEVVALWAASRVALQDDPGAVRSYRRAIELDPGRVDWYVRLALLLRRGGKPDQIAEADRVMNEMVTKNPRAPNALLARARYRIKFRTGSPATDLATAVELEPTSVEVRLTAAEAAESAEAARVHLRFWLKNLPIDERLYLTFAAVERRDGNRAAAAKILREGINRLPGNANLLFTLADLALEVGELDETKRMLIEIGRWKHSPERAVLLRARLHMIEGNWPEARKVLETGRPALTTASPELAVESDVLLGRCLERLGEDDLALAAYRRAVAGDPTRADAQTGVARTLLALNRLGEAVERYRQLAWDPAAGAEAQLMYARLRVLEYLSTPLKSRRASDLDPVFARAAEKAPKAFELLLLRVEVLAADRQPDEAEKLLRAALADTPGATDLALTLARLLYRQGKVADAWATLAALDRTAGASASVELALTRLDLVPAPDNTHRAEAIRAVEELLKRTERAEDRLRLCGGLTEAHTRWGNIADARRWCLEIARLRPADLSVRLRLLALAVQADDRSQMEEAVREIHRAEGGSGPFGQYAEAVLRIARPGDRTPDGFREARQYLVAASLARPTWAAPVSTRALLTELEGGKPDEALAEYQRAVDLGERRHSVILRAVQLLCARRRYPEADRLLQKLRPEGASTQLTKLAAEVSLFNQQSDRAIELAAGVVAANPNEYEEHLWQAEILAAAGKGNEALVAYRRAVDLAGPHGAPWVALVRHHVRSGQKDKAEEVFAELGRRLAGQELALTSAQCLEALERTEQAAEAYRKAVESQPNDVEALHQLFAFHDRTDTPAAALPALRRALGAQPPLPPADLAWTQRALAIALSRTGDYTSFQEAIRVVDRALSATPEDPDALLTKARVLATRLSHRREALKILEQVRRQRPFGPDEEFFIGQLYADTGTWVEGRRILVNLLAREGENATYLRFFVERLVRIGPLSEAETWLDRLERVAPDAPATIRLRAVLLVKRGEFRDAAAHLKRSAHPPTAPRVSSAGADAERTRVRTVARITDSLGAERDAGPALFPLAEALYREAAKGGTIADELALAGFLGRRGRVEEAVKIARTVEDRAGAAAVARTLLTALYSTDPLTDKQLDALEVEIVACLGRANAGPETAGLTGLVHARRGRYADAARAFRSVVEAGKADPETLNNLAYMLVLANTNPAEVSSLLEKTLARVGPSAGLLDTRGMAHLAAGRTAEAVADFEQAVEQAPSAAKCLHLAMAYHRTDRAKDAAALLDRADALRSDGSLVLPAEQAAFQKLMRDVKLPR